jgi:hypothetical protein
MYSPVFMFTPKAAYTDTLFIHMLYTALFIYHYIMAIYIYICYIQDVNSDARDAKITAALLEFQQAIRDNNKAIVERNKLEAHAWESDKDLKGQKYYAYNTLLKEVILLFVQLHILIISSI